MTTSLRSITGKESLSTQCVLANKHGEYVVIRGYGTGAWHRTRIAADATRDTQERLARFAALIGTGEWRSRAVT